MRLHKFIANCGYTSRRHAELLIQAGRVKVNGRVVSSPGTTVRPERDIVSINEETIRLPEPLTVAFNKPAGLLTSTHDTHERLTVMDYLPRSMREQGLLPAGRLDRDTEGLLILTNVGDLNHRITHPRYGTEKEYVVNVEEQPDAEALARLEQGIVLEGVRTSPARLTRVEPVAGGVEINIVIREGRKRQVKKMFSAVGHDVVRLRRVRIGGLQVGDLAPGEWRELTAGEIDALLGRSGTQPEREETSGER